jgi:hypothetical protein
MICNPGDRIAEKIPHSGFFIPTPPDFAASPGYADRTDFSAARTTASREHRVNN